MKDVMKIFSTILHEMFEVIKNYFSGDVEVMDDKVRVIMGDPEKKKEFLKAIDRLEEGSEKESVKVSDNMSIDIVL